MAQSTLPLCMMMRAVNLTLKDPSAPVELLYAGTFHLADRNMKLEITPAMIDQMVANFEAMDGPERVAFNVNHRSTSGNLEEAKAVGWFQKLYAEAREVGDEKRYSLMAVPSWTEVAAKAIAEGEFKYLSAEIQFQATNTLTGEQVGPRVRGAALTNIPAIPKLTPICLSVQDDGLMEEVQTLLLEKSMGDKMRQISGAFYKAFSRPGEPGEVARPSAYVREVFDTSVIASEDDGPMFRVRYLWRNGEPVFQPRAEWTEVEQVYQDVTSFVDAANSSVVEGSIPQAATQGGEPEGHDMDETKVRELLGLSADGDIMATLTALKDKAGEVDGLKARVSALETAKPEPDAALTEARQQVQTLSQRADAFESQATKLAQQVEEMQARENLRLRDDRIGVALSQGRVTPAELDAEDGYLREMALKDGAGFEKLMRTRPAKPELFVEQGSSAEGPKASIDELFALIDEKVAKGMDRDDARVAILRERPDLLALTKKGA